jgi:hypothetical protein
MATLPEVSILSPLTVKFALPDGDDSQSSERFEVTWCWTKR